MCHKITELCTWQSHPLKYPDICEFCIVAASWLTNIGQDAAKMRNCWIHLAALPVYITDQLLVSLAPVSIHLTWLLHANNSLTDCSFFHQPYETEENDNDLFLRFMLKLVQNMEQILRQWVKVIRYHPLGNERFSSRWQNFWFQLQIQQMILHTRCGLRRVDWVEFNVLLAR